VTQEEFKTLIQKNKAAAGGILFAALIFVTDVFYLKPAREARRKALLQGTQTPSATAAPDAGAALPTDPGAGSAMPVPPPELFINLGEIPPLNQKVESRFSVKTDYPYPLRRNVFYTAKKEEPILEPTPVYTEEVATPTSRPDITYHGFYNVGPDKIAIMRLAQRLLLARMGQRLDESPFVLELILGDRVLIRDLEHADDQFEVNLAEATPAKAGPGSGSGGQLQGR